MEQKVERASGGDMNLRNQVSAWGARVRSGNRAQRANVAPSTQVQLAEPERTGTVTAPAVEAWMRAGRGPVGGAAKRALDVLGASAGLLVLAPFLGLIWLAVRLERSGGEAIFKQERGGLGGRPFVIYKFRTMTCAENGSDARQVRWNDARVTRLGAVLRKMSWDELPQLFNVLRGDMSLVGPRPHPVVMDREFAAVDPSYQLRFRARPGITGLAQVSGCRGPTETEGHVRARTQWDVRYVANWSFWGDIGILWRTLLLFVKRDPRAI